MHKSITIGTCLLITGCAMPGEMLPGKIYSIDDARILAFEIETTFDGNGRVHAVDPVTKEVYEGTYNAITELVGVSSTSTARVRGSSVTSNTYGNAISNMAAANAVLMGNQGNILDCVIDIQAGARPRGNGSCVDKDKKTYRLQF